MEIIKQLLSNLVTSKALDRQLNEKNYQINKLEHNMGEIQNGNMLLNKELQFKLTRHDGAISKAESDNINMISMMKDLQSQLMETQRVMQMRMSDMEVRLNELGGKLDSILSEQTMVIKGVEGDTIKQLQLLDTKTRSVRTEQRSDTRYDQMSRRR